MATAKKKAVPAKKAPTKKSSDGSNLDDMKYTQKWHDAKISEYSAKLAQAKIDAPNLVKGIKEDIAWLKNSRNNSVKVAPMGPRGGNPSGARGNSGGIGGRGMRGGGGAMLGRGK
jgi:hypothetical protein